MDEKFKTILHYYNEYFDKIYRYVFYRSGREKSITEDLTSEIFLKALENFSTYDQNRPFGVWIYRIAHNHLVDHYKKTSRKVVSLDEIVEQGEEETFPVSMDIKMNVEHISRAMNKLPILQKEVLVLKYFNDLTTNEILGVLNIQENHLRVLLHRGLRALKNQVGA